MALVEYTGFSHFRELAKADFKKLGVEGQTALTWAKGEIKEVSEDIANALHELLSDEFQKVEEDAKAATASTKKNSSSTKSTNPPEHRPEDSSSSTPAS